MFFFNDIARQIFKKSNEEGCANIVTVGRANNFLSKSNVMHFKQRRFGIQGYKQYLCLKKKGGGSQDWAGLLDSLKKNFYMSVKCRTELKQEKIYPSLCSERTYSLP